MPILRYSFYQLIGSVKLPIDNCQPLSHNLPMLEKFLTPTEFAVKKGLTRQRIHVLMREGRIPYERHGRQYFIRRDASVKVAKANRHKKTTRALSSVG